MIWSDHTHNNNPCGKTNKYDCSSMSVYQGTTRCNGTNKDKPIKHLYGMNTLKASQHEACPWFFIDSIDKIEKFDGI